MKLLLLGGYGNFGARIARALAGEPGIELVLAGRDAARAERLARELGVAWQRVDAGDDAELARALRAGGFGLVVHTAGPFQGQDWRVAAAAAEAGAHYIDLADGRRFVCDFGTALDARFRAAGRVGITGASTLPALSTAVIAHLKPRFGAIETIDLCIAPAQQAPRGLATMQAVLGYCGEPFRARQQGRDVAVRGWLGLQRIAFARMPARRGAWCDVPDLELLPALDDAVHGVSFRAALEVGAAQWSLALLAALRACRMLPPLAAWAGALDRAARSFDRFGSATGGMVVRLKGRCPAGQPLSLAWHLTAPNNHGPEVPCMAAIALARRLADGEPLRPGARACVAELPLADFEPQFARFGMTVDVVEETGTLA